MTGGRAHLARVEDPSTGLRMQYGRSGAWARIAHSDAQRLLDAIEGTGVEPQPPVLRLASATAAGDGGQA